MSIKPSPIKKLVSSTLFQGSNTDEDWEWFGANDPYYGVVAFDKFRNENLDGMTRDHFFDGGRKYLEQVLYIAKTLFPNQPIPSHALDFGCGVGRLTLPLAAHYEQVTGVDISPSMLAEAQTNSQNRNVGNVNFIHTEALDSQEAGFDLIHSYIVFQHIPVEQGYDYTEVLLDRLRPGGIGILHYTYRSDKPKHLSKSSLMMKLYKTIPFLYRMRSAIRNEPIMQMNEYDLNVLLGMLQSTRCSTPSIHFTQHGEVGGVLLFFQKSPANRAVVDTD